MKRVCMLFLSILIPLTVAVMEALAESHPWDNDPRVAADVRSWLKEVETAVRIRSDPLLRTIVCRVPYADFTIGTLAKATGKPPIAIAIGASKLVDRGLVRLERDAAGNIKVVPNGDDARVRMRKWADDWCIGDENCSAQP